MIMNNFKNQQKEKVLLHNKKLMIININYVNTKRIFSKI